MTSWAPALVWTVGLAALFLGGMLVGAALWITRRERQAMSNARASIEAWARTYDRRRVSDRRKIGLYPGVRYAGPNRRGSSRRAPDRTNPPLRFT